MIKILAASLFAIVACAFAVAAMPSTLIASHEATPASFDIAMPAAQEPLDATPVASAHMLAASQNQ